MNYLLFPHSVTVNLVARVCNIQYFLYHFVTVVKQFVMCLFLNKLCLDCKFISTSYSAMAALLTACPSSH